MNTGERPVSETKEALPSMMQETYKMCGGYVKDKVVLDVGCGEGLVDLFIKDIAREIVGIDVDTETVEKANRNFYGTNMKFYRMSGEKLDFPDESFDVIISSQSIEHIQDDRAFLNEVRRVLKKSGVFICTTPNKLACVPDGEKPLDTPYYPFHVREYTPKQFYSLMEEYLSVEKKLCYFNPDRSRKFINSPRGRLVYRLSGFKVIRWLARNLSMGFKNKALLFMSKDKTLFEDRGTAGCEYCEKLGFEPDVIGAICRKIR